MQPAKSKSMLSKQPITRRRRVVRLWNASVRVILSNCLPIWTEIEMTPVYQTPPRPPFHHPTVSRATKLDWHTGAKINYIQNTSMALNHAVLSGPELYCATSCCAAPQRQYKAEWRYTMLHRAELHNAVLRCIALNCAVLRCTARYCAALRWTALYCAELRCTALYCAALRCTALYYAVLRCTALHCAALRCIALPCAALRFIAHTALY